MRGLVSVVGVGTTGVGRFTDVPVAELAHRALATALDDAGLTTRDVDGLVVHIGSPRGMDYDTTAETLGLRTRYNTQSWAHGRFGATAIQQAAMALSWGLADTIVCLAAYHNTTMGLIGERAGFTFDESMREGGGPHAETPVAGFIGPVATAAMAARRYFHRYGVDREKLAAVPMAFRRHAMLNPSAAQRKPMSLDDYASAKPIVDPLRLLDCASVVDGAVALVLTLSDKAKDMKAMPIPILGMQGLHAGPEEFIFGQPGLGVAQPHVYDYVSPGADQTVYRMAGLKPSDIDTLQVYDAFSPLVLYTLERFGFCAPGGALDFVQDGRIQLGGALPTNTSGGMLSEGHLNGWNQFVELLAQLRGQAGARQVPNARHGMWGTALGDAIIFGRPA